MKKCFIKSEPHLNMRVVLLLAEQGPILYPQSLEVKKEEGSVGLCIMNFRIISELSEMNHGQLHVIRKLHTGKSFPLSTLVCAFYSLCNICPKISILKCMLMCKELETHIISSKEPMSIWRR